MKCRSTPLRYAVAVRPLVEHLAGELRTVVHHQAHRIAANGSDLIQDPGHSTSWQRGVDLDGRALTRQVVHDVERAEASPVTERVLCEVHRPFLVGSCRHSQRRADPSHSLPTPAPHLQLLLALQAMDTLVVYQEPFSPQQDS
jgi:hypothetical protein